MAYVSSACILLKFVALVAGCEAHHSMRHQNNLTPSATPYHDSESARNRQSCSGNMEGMCRSTSDKSMLIICASGLWQAVPRGQWDCFQETLRLTSSTSALRNNLVVATTSTPPVQSSAPNLDTSANGTNDQTGYAYCSKAPVQAHADTFGKTSYISGGKMASAYEATTGSVFRCDIAPPESGYYVAFWTPYQPDAPSQPAPHNCNDSITVRNPKTGKSANATVIDRCASCVGVGRQTSDPTTSDMLVNGATIDLSIALWNFLYDSAPLSVYDIEYPGNTYAGALVEPSMMTSPMCTA